jgi:topoisomerase IV subunit A
VLDEPVTVVVSTKGWVRALKGHEIETSSLAFKAGDSLYGTFACRSVDTLLVFGTQAKGSGRVYSLPAAGLPGGRGDGVPITSLIDLEAGTTVAHYFAGPPDAVLLVANTAGYGLLAKVADMTGRNKGGKNFLSLDEGSHVLPPVAVDAAHTQVACLAMDSRLLVFALAELKLQSAGGKGLTLMDVDAPAPLVSVATLAGTLRVLGSGRGGKAKDELLKGVALADHVGKRARKGKAVAGIKATRVLVG